MEVAAGLMMQLGTTSKVYMINKASYSSEAEVRKAAKAVVGQTGSKGALGLEVITAGSGDEGAIVAMAKSLTTAVSFATPFPPPFNLRSQNRGARRRSRAPTGSDQSLSVDPPCGVWDGVVGVFWARTSTMVNPGKTVFEKKKSKNKKVT